MAMKAGDASSCGEILELFDAAIRANPSSPVLYLNKASCLLQVRGPPDGGGDVLLHGVWLWILLMVLAVTQDFRMSYSSLIHLFL